MSEKKLNAEQQIAVTHAEGPLLIIAGAGTGKTTVITERIKNLIQEKNILPSQILALTFTEKAANEMETRIDESLPLGYTQMWVLTFHGFCDRVLRERAIHIGLDPKYRLMSTAESLHFLREHLFDLDLNYFRPLGNPTKFLFGLLSHFSRLQDEDISPTQYLSWAEAQMSGVSKSQEADKDPAALEAQKWLELARAYKTYNELKVTHSVFDFGDVIVKVLELFRERPNILMEYQSRFPHILVDEYQDTNYAQNELTKLLAGETANIAVVLDDDQSIYRFRGAAISNALQFRQSFPQTKVVTLTKNYRSFQGILDRAHVLISHNNPDRLEVIEGINKHLIAERDGVSHIEFLFSNTAYEEADRVVSEIQKCIGDGYSYGDIAILVRANNHADSFVRALTTNDIPFLFLGPSKLFLQEEIIDLISYMQLLSNINNSQALYRVLSIPFFAVNPLDIAKLFSWAKVNSSSLIDALKKIDEIEVTDETKEKVKKLYELMLQHIKQKARESAGTVLYSFLTDSGILSHYLKEETVQGVVASENIAKFFTKIKQYESVQSNVSVESVLDWIELQRDLGESPLAAEVDVSDSDAVKIITVHSSKGLEFPVVFMVNLVTQRFPSMNRSEQIPIPDQLIREVLPTGDHHIQEERRLFYVGMTRAKDRLYFTAAKMYGDGKREKKVSPFVVEALGDISLTTQESIVLPEVIKPPIRPVEKAPLKIDYLSYSQIETFKVCPLHYKLRYLVKLPSPASPASSMGNSFHSVMKALYEEQSLGNPISPALADELLIKHWRAEGYSSAKHMEQSKEKIRGFLHYFTDTLFDPTQKTLCVEIPFTFKVGALKVGGIIDRVDQDGEILHIIDYKTGSSSLSQSEADKNLQLSIYALAASKIQEPPFGVPASKIKLSLLYFDDPQIVTTYRTIAQLKAAEEEILQWKDEIEKSDFRCSGNYFCQSCEYKMFCSSETGD